MLRICYNWMIPFISKVSLVSECSLEPENSSECLRDLQEIFTGLNYSLKFSQARKHVAWLKYPHPTTMLSRPAHGPKAAENCPIFFSVWNLFQERAFHLEKSQSFWESSLFISSIYGNVSKMKIRVKNGFDAEN